MTSQSIHDGARRRSTRQRAAILNALRNASGFRSAQVLHSEMSEVGEPVGLATVYRNLQSLADAGEVDVVQNEAGEAIFRLCAGTEHHHHLVCRRCGRSEEVAADEVESWAIEVARKHKFRDVTHTAELFGLCDVCAG